MSLHKFLFPLKFLLVNLFSNNSCSTHFFREYKFLHELFFKDLDGWASKFLQHGLAKLGRYEIKYFLKLLNKKHQLESIKSLFNWLSKVFKVFFNTQRL